MSGRAIVVDKLEVRASGRTILKSVSLSIERGEILGVIGPAGSGKTTFLRVLNRLCDLDLGLTISGSALLDGRPILDQGADLVDLRRRVGLVFSVPTALPMSIFDNLAFGPRLAGASGAKKLAARAEECLRSAFLWEEVKDRLDLPAGNLSGGQQQRLCLARSLMLAPEVLLLDEPCSGLDPISTAKIEEALTDLKKTMAIVLVTNNVKQASRVADKTAFLLLGELVEFAPTVELFTNPKDKRTEDYITGRFG